MPLATVAVLAFIAFAGLASGFPPSLPLSSQAYAQTQASTAPAPSESVAKANSAPQFPSSETGVRSVDENTPSYQNIGAPVTATDPNNDTLTYSLENAGASHFGIVRSTGQLQAGAPLDYETRSSYTVKVIATDPSGATAKIPVTINVNNVDEPGTVSLTWTKPQVDTEVEASLADPDGEVSGVTWQWAKADAKEGNYADISEATSATYTPDAADKHQYLRATASYTDPLGSAKTARSAAAYVKPVPDPNQAPEFQVNTSGGYGCDRWDGVTAHVCLYVSRSAPAGSDIYYPAYVHITDHDEVRYSLGGTDSGLFRIGPLSGKLFTTGAHAYDDPGTDGKFEITITASDPSGESDSITVVLRPSGSPGSPAVNGPERITYPENGTWPLAVYSATASNPDRDIRGWIINVQPGGGDGDFFDIDDDGALTFTQPPDYEDPADENGDNRYSFSIMSYDTNPPNRRRPGQTFYSVTVTVTNVEESLEIRGPTAVDYAENGTDAVATYTVSGADGQVAWSLSGDDAGEFTISDRGVLTFNTPPDYENPTDTDSKNDYLLSITITETDGDVVKMEPVRVEVTNVNELPTFDEGETATRSVGENAGAHEDVGAPLTATDPDGDSLTYTLEDAATLPFTISTYSGQLQVDDGLDHETRPSYTVTVSVSDRKDADGNSDDTADDTITVTISVTGENEAPVFSSSEPRDRSVPETTPAGQNIGPPVAATDPEGEAVAYTLEVPDAASFAIVETSGQLQTKSPLDYETKSSHTVTVIATDLSNVSETITVTITVTDVEEIGAVTLSSTQPQVGTALSATLEDPDGGVSGTAWSWESSSDRTIWATISSATSASYTPVEGDVGRYLQATASYTDGHGSGKTAQAASDNTVRATNSAPAFAGETPTRTVPENTPAGRDIGTPVAATDDNGDALTYSLSGTDAASFNIVSTSGQLQTKSNLDYESKSSYTVTVSVHDGKDANGNADTTVDDTITLTITVTDENEPPVFPSTDTGREVD